MGRHPNISHAVAVDDTDANNMRIFFELAVCDMFDCSFGEAPLSRREQLR